MTTNLSRSTNQKKRRDKKLANGICIYCDNPHRLNKTTCQQCADKIKISAKKYREKKKLKL